MTLESNPEFWWPRLTARRTSAQEPYYYMRGRGMGGSSTVNGLCAIRGVPADYDRWAELGAAGGVTNARGLAGMYRPLAKPTNVCTELTWLYSTPALTECGPRKIDTLLFS